MAKHLTKSKSWTAQVPKQLVSILFTAIFCPAVTLLILFALRAVFGSLRVNDESEALGLDRTEHSEAGYNLENQQEGNAT